jgi:aminoglycoside phosphotransferase (APT) family kinase protein
MQDDPTLAVRRFWRRAAPKFGLPAELDAVTVRASSPRAIVVMVRAGEKRMIVRGPPGALLRVDPEAGRAARLQLFVGETGLGPRVLFWEQGALELDGQPVVVSEAVEGREPDRDWFRDNLRQAAAMLARLHRDADLGEALENQGRGDPRADCLAMARAARADLEARLDRLAGQDWPPEAAALLPRLAGHLAWFGAQIQGQRAAFSGVRVGPVHGDVNNSNWLIDGANRAWLIDWDGLRLEDPALDLGMLLHWYVPPALWPVFALAYAEGGEFRPDPEALLARARLRYPLHALHLGLHGLEALRAGEFTLAEALAFVEPFLSDLDRLRGGRFGTGAGWEGPDLER